MLQGLVGLPSHRVDGLHGVAQQVRLHVCGSRRARCLRLHLLEHGEVLQRAGGILGADRRSGLSNCDSAWHCLSDADLRFPISCVLIGIQDACRSVSSGFLLIFDPVDGV